MAKYIEVYLGGPDGDIWSSSVEEIAKNRVKHFHEKAEIDESSDQYKRLVEVSSRQNEVEDWARRFVAPDVLRNSWYNATIFYHQDDKRHQLALQQSKDLAAQRKARKEQEEKANARSAATA